MSITKMKKNTSRGSINKSVSIVILLTFLILFLFVAVKIIKRQNRDVKPPPSKSSQSEKTIEISGVKMKDFTNGIERADQQSYITLSRTKDYHIFYIPSQTVFFVSIVSYPFDTYVAIAEADLLDKLSIPEKEACKLTVDITTPAFANPDKAGKTYDLSFCEN